VALANLKSVVRVDRHRDDVRRVGRVLVLVDHSQTLARVDDPHVDTRVANREDVPRRDVRSTFGQVRRQLCSLAIRRDHRGTAHQRADAELANVQLFHLTSCRLRSFDLEEKQTFSLSRALCPMATRKYVNVRAPSFDGPIAHDPFVICSRVASDCPPDALGRAGCARSPPPPPNKSSLAGDLLTVTRDSADAVEQRLWICRNGFYSYVAKCVVKRPKKSREDVASTHFACVTRCLKERNETGKQSKRMNGIGERVLFSIKGARGVKEK
jgi:hypothetical protein